MDVLSRHVINENITRHELKYAHSSKLIIWNFLWFFFLMSSTLNKFVQQFKCSNMKWKWWRKNCSEKKCNEIYKLFWSSHYQLSIIFGLSENSTWKLPWIDFSFSPANETGYAEVQNLPGEWGFQLPEVLGWIQFLQHLSHVAFSKSSTS